MSRIESFSSLLVESDFVYLSKKYDLDLNFVRGMNDDSWCAYLGCQVDELAFYLLEDDIYEETLAIEDELEENYELFDERYDEDSMDALFEETDLSELIIDLSRERESRSKPTHPSQYGFQPKVSGYPTARDFAPYKPKPKKKPVKAPHFLVAVY
jgi:hypothetical protein